MNNSNGSGFHKFSNWFIAYVPGMAVFIAIVIVLSLGEFVDGVQGRGCDASIDFVTSPQSIWMKGGCVINNLRQVIPSRNSNSNNTAP